MRNSHPQLLDALFDDISTVARGPLQNIQQRAIALLKLNRAVKSTLPAQLHPWCRVANFRQGILVIETANANWLMRLRYEQSQLLSTLRGGILPSLSSIDIRINPSLMINQKNFSESKLIPGEQNNENKKPLRQLSHESAEELERLAERSPEKLRRALKKLAALAGERANTAK